MHLRNTIIDIEGIRDTLLAAAVQKYGPQNLASAGQEQTIAKQTALFHSKRDVYRLQKYHFIIC
jgi:hypothetical protein